MLQADFINVGYGDAILIREKAQDCAFSMLVDCGDTGLGSPPPGSLRIGAADFLRMEGVESLDLLVLTHMHRDHIGGLDALTQAVRVKALMTPYLPRPALWGAIPQPPEDAPKRVRGFARTMGMLLPALTRLDAQGAVLLEVTQPSGGIRLTPALTMELACGPAALYAQQRAALNGLLCGEPDADALDALGENINHTSLRLTLRYHGKSILLAGDAYGEGWEQEAQPCDILKTPHHGCGRSLTPALVERLSPSLAVISVSNDREDDRPSPAVVELLLRAGARVECTDAVALPGLETRARHSVRVELA